MNILGARQIDFAIQGMLRRIDDWRPLWPRLTELFHATESKQFASEGGVGARGNWVPLSPRYAEQKRRRWGKRKILVASGRLRSSLTARTGSAIVEDANPLKLVLGTRVPYAMYHQTGTPFMPQRRPVDLTARQNLAFAKEFHKFVNTDALKGFKKTGQMSMPMGVRV